MMLRITLIGIFLLSLSATRDAGPAAFTGEISAREKQMQLEDYSTELYESIGGEFEKPSYDVFHEAVVGYFKLKALNRLDNELLTIIDFTLPSSVERMWIVDVPAKRIIHRSLVAHGQKSGNEYATEFSNTHSSHQSSLGFYITGKVYTGKHGTSLYLDGIEEGINDNARERAVVMHSADYVSQDFIKAYGRLGRSFGCPAIPVEHHEEIIRTLAGKSCLYIYHDSPGYHSQTRMKADRQTLTAMEDFLNGNRGYTAASHGSIEHLH